MIYIHTAVRVYTGLNGAEWGCALLALLCSSVNGCYPLNDLFTLSRTAATSSRPHACHLLLKSCTHQNTSNTTSLITHTHTHTHTHDSPPPSFQHERVSESDKVINEQKRSIGRQATRQGNLNRALTMMSRSSAHLEGRTLADRSGEPGSSGQRSFKVRGEEEEKSVASQARSVLFECWYEPVRLRHTY